MICWLGVIIGLLAVPVAIFVLLCGVISYIDVDMDNVKR